MSKEQAMIDDMRLRYEIEDWDFGDEEIEWCLNALDGQQKHIRKLETELAEFYKPVIKDHNITEIIPDDMPDWARQAMKEGRFFSVALNRIKSLEDKAWSGAITDVVITEGE